MPIIITPGAPSVAPVTAVSADGRLRATVDPEHGGTLLEADFSASANRPKRVRFVRSDGTPVRSGTDAWAPGGQAVAYDLEAPLGVATSWRAIPINGNGTITGSATGYVAMIAPDATPEADFWIKSVADPGLSVRLQAQGPDPTSSLDGRSALSPVPGSALPGATWDVATAGPLNYTFRTYSHAERDAVLAVLGAGPLLIQCLRLYGIPDAYAVMTGVTITSVVGAYDPRRDIAVTFAPIGRPPAEEAPLYIPGRSYDDLLGQYLTYDQVESSATDYAGLIR